MKKKLIKSGIVIIISIVTVLSSSSFSLGSVTTKEVKTNNDYNFTMNLGNMNEWEADFHIIGDFDDTSEFIDWADSDGIYTKYRSDENIGGSSGAWCIGAAEKGGTWPDVSVDVSSGYTIIQKQISAESLLDIDEKPGFEFTSAQLEIDYKFSTDDFDATLDGGSEVKDWVKVSGYLTRSNDLDDNLPIEEEWNNKNFPVSSPGTWKEDEGTFKVNNVEGDSLNSWLNTHARSRTVTLNIKVKIQLYGDWGYGTGNLERFKLLIDNAKIKGTYTYNDQPTLSIDPEDQLKIENVEYGKNVRLDFYVQNIGTGSFTWKIENIDEIGDTIPVHTQPTFTKKSGGPISQGNQEKVTFEFNVPNNRRAYNKVFKWRLTIEGYGAAESPKTLDIIVKTRVVKSHQYINSLENLLDSRFPILMHFLNRLPAFQ